MTRKDDGSTPNGRALRDGRRRLGLTRRALARLLSDLGHDVARRDVRAWERTGLLPDPGISDTFEGLLSATSGNAPVPVPEIEWGNGPGDTVPQRQWMFPRDVAANASAASDPGAVRIVAHDIAGLEPWLQAGDWMVVDTSVRAFSGDGIYLLWEGARAVASRLSKAPGPDGRVRISSGPGDLQSREAEAKRLVVLGKVTRRISAVR